MATCWRCPSTLLPAVLDSACSPPRRCGSEARLAVARHGCLQRETGQHAFVRLHSQRWGKRAARRMGLVMGLGGNNNNSPSEEHKWVDDSQADYVEATVVDAVRLVPKDNALVMKMADGKFVRLMHANAAAGRLLHASSVPTIFLKMEDETDMMLPIVVGELPSQMLMKALRKESGARPTIYEVMRDMVESMKYEVKMVRLTQRVVDTYYARVYMSKQGESELISVDARPSDAINLAVRCNVKIFVNKTVVAADGVRPVYTMPDPDTNYLGSPAFRTNILTSKLDSPMDGELDPIAEEVVLMRNMIVAASEERYSDAARLRDELTQLRSRVKRQRQV